MIAIYVMKCDLFGRCHMWESFYFARLLSLCGEYTLSPILIDRIPWLLKLRKKAPMVFVSISKIIHKPYKMKQQKKYTADGSPLGTSSPRKEMILFLIYFISIFSFAAEFFLLFIARNHLLVETIWFGFFFFHNDHHIAFILTAFRVPDSNFFQYLSLQCNLLAGFISNQFFSF